MCVMLKIVLSAILIVIIFSIILIKNKKQAIQIYSIQTFLGSSSHSFEDEPNEQKKSLIDVWNDYFVNSKDDISDGTEDIGDDGDAGE